MGEALRLRRRFTIDKERARVLGNRVYDGLGMVSANNSSRLLLDYKSEQPQVYQRLLEYIFGEKGLALNLIKVEMGSDCNSSSGTEPAVKRTADEIADVTRGAGYQLIKDALAVNPDLQTDLLPWGIPCWVENAENKYAARYQWYKQTIDALYDTYQIKVNYVTATQNEKPNDVEWIKYLAKALGEEADGRYDYGRIKIVAGEGVCDWKIADYMLEDEELMRAVDVVSAHYTSFVDSKAKLLQMKYGKKLWFSEGASPMTLSRATYKYDSTGTGLNDINGMLDIAVRLTQAFTEGMTMYEFQPVVSAYYDGVSYCSKQLITANEPWNGAYNLDTGFYMGLHFSRFIKKGWFFVDDACFGDGVAGGDGHAMVDSTYNYLTAISPDMRDFSTVLVNQTDKIIVYEISLERLNLRSDTVSVWETKANAASGGDYYSSFLKKISTASSKEAGEGKKVICVELAPYSLMTVTSLDVNDIKVETADSHGEVLALPYKDDFEYEDKPSDFLRRRGNAPLYTTDQEGAFEVACIEGNNVLLQRITEELKPHAWAGLEKPTTNLGDDRWHNYNVSIDVHFTGNSTDCENNYVGLGARYSHAAVTYSGYWLKLSDNGTATLMKKDKAVAEKKLEAIDLSAWHSLSLTVCDNKITAKVDGKLVISYTDEMEMYNSGRVALYSNFANNYFDNLIVASIDDYTYIERIDDMEAGLQFSEACADNKDAGWSFDTTCGFNFYKRSCSVGGAGASFTYRFEGSYCALLGPCSDATLEITVDGSKKTLENIQCGERSCFFATEHLPYGEHELTVGVISGRLYMDAVELIRR